MRGINISFLLNYCIFLFAIISLCDVAAQFQRHHHAPDTPGFLKKADDEQWRIIRRRYNINSSDIKVPEELSKVTQYKGPVDIVITWLDPKDPIWQESFRSYGFTFEPDRFTSSREIEINLASISVYFPNCGNIFLLTDQRMDLEFLPSSFREKISFVKHNVIIDQQYLPTFSANVLEANLWKIPGLSEIFMYLNDDFFLTRPFDIDRIINSGPQLIVPSSYSPKWCDPIILKMEALERAHNIDYTNTNNLFINKFGYCIPYMNTNHVPYILSVSLNRYAAELYAEVVHEQNKNRVRSYVSYKKGGDMIFLYLSLYIGEYYGLIKFSSNYTSSFGDQSADSAYEIFRSTAKKPSSDFMTIQNLPTVSDKKFHWACKLYFTTLCARDPNAPFCDFQICNKRYASLYGDNNMSLFLLQYGRFEYFMYAGIIISILIYLFKKRIVVKNWFQSTPKPGV